jgi:hypothetical protein
MLPPAVCIAVVICRTVIMSGRYRLLAAGSVNALRVACCCTLYSLARRPRAPSCKQQSRTQCFRHVLPGLNISSTLTANSATAFQLPLTVPQHFGRLRKFPSSAHSDIHNLGSVCGGSKCDRNTDSLALSYSRLDPADFGFVTVLQKLVSRRCNF